MTSVLGKDANGISITIDKAERRDMYLDREPMKHAEYREKVIQRQIDLMHERGIWVKPGF